MANFIQALRKLGSYWPGPKVAQAITPVPVPTPALTTPVPAMDPMRAVSRERLAVYWPLTYTYLSYIDPETEETTEIREAYRKMLREPAIKAAIKTKVDAVAGLAFQIQPYNESPRSQEIAECLHDGIAAGKGGMPGIVRTMCMGALIDGVSVSDPVFVPFERGRWRDKMRLASFKGKDINKLQIHCDEWQNVTGVQSITGADSRIYPPELFVIFTNSPLFGNPAGQSDLRAAYRAYFSKALMWSLRLQYLEKFTGPFIKASYPKEQEAELRQQLEHDLPMVKSRMWTALPSLRR